MVEYYALLEKQSGGRMKVINMGPTSEGNPFLDDRSSRLPPTWPSWSTCAKSTPVSAIRAALSEAQARTMADEAQAIVVQTMSMHANETGGAQMAPELTYDLLARKDEEASRILDNVIFIEVPCFNPDGEIMYTDWYNKTLGTPNTKAPTRRGSSRNTPATTTTATLSVEPAGFALRRQDPFHRLEAGSLCRSPPHGRLRRAIFMPPYAEPIRLFADPLI